MWKDRDKFVGRMAEAIENARVRMDMAQSNYKRNYYRLMKSSNPDIRTGDFLYLNQEEGKNISKLAGHALGPFLVLGRTPRTFNAIVTIYYRGSRG